MILIVTKTQIFVAVKNQRHSYTSPEYVCSDPLLMCKCAKVLGVS